MDLHHQNTEGDEEDRCSKGETLHQIGKLSAYPLSAFAPPRIFYRISGVAGIFNPRYRITAGESNAALIQNSGDYWIGYVRGRHARYRRDPRWLLEKFAAR
jgi:hypothetical protein